MTKKNEENDIERQVLTCLMKTHALRWINYNKTCALAQELQKITLFTDNFDLFEKRVSGFALDQEELKTLEELSIKIAETVATDTSPNSLVLFSGETMVDAETYVSAHHEYVLIHSLPAGAMLEMLNLFDKNLSLLDDARRKPWNILAKRLCEQAQGNVKAIINQPKETATFLNVEMPALLENKAVLTINRQEKLQFFKGLEIGR